MKREYLFLIGGMLGSFLLLGIGYFGVISYNEYSEFREWKRQNNEELAYYDSVEMEKEIIEKNDKRIGDSLNYIDSIRKVQYEENVPIVRPVERERNFDYDNNSNNENRATNVQSSIPGPQSIEVAPQTKNDLKVTAINARTYRFLANKIDFYVKNVSKNHYSNVIVRLHFANGKVKDYNLRGKFSPNTWECVTLLGDLPSYSYYEVL
jgi:hypothetical protein